MDSELGSHWEITPHIGVGVLRFGQKRADVRAMLGEPSRTFKKVPFADTLTDAYVSLGIHLFYDPHDQLESIDTFPPATIRFGNIPLLDVPVDGLVHELAKRGYAHDGYAFEDAGFSLYVVDGIVKSISAFVKGCHDTTDPNSQRSRALRAAEEWRQARDLGRGCT